MIWGIIDRWKAAKERSFSGLKTEVWLSINEARLVYASGEWLEKYQQWVEEAAKSKGSIGVYPADTTLSFAAKFMKDIAAKIDKDNPRMILNDRGMKVLKDCASHLDHYGMLMAVKEKPKGNWKKR
jgi:hypothetical protein